ncbi:PcfJ domain-containing protein [Photobacterium kishitanii]|uniref:Uncharacterized protein n=1 Tax=Photobacterium kishitanii TaxID=318456 RepID=A0A2T3KMC2_9GAMM|nr:PcfJ domain-containing protein [Photobacterium kishitanii]PSV00946.1 hypothetical protein C9J27_02670 [Photobacterium kishitanii]
MQKITSTLLDILKHKDFGADPILAKNAKDKTEILIDAYNKADYSRRRIENDKADIVLFFEPEYARIDRQNENVEILGKVKFVAKRKSDNQFVASEYHKLGHGRKIHNRFDDFPVSAAITIEDFNGLTVEKLIQKSKNRSDTDALFNFIELGHDVAGVYSEMGTSSKAVRRKYDIGQNLMQLRRIISIEQLENSNLTELSYPKFKNLGADYKSSIPVILNLKTIIKNEEWLLKSAEFNNNEQQLITNAALETQRANESLNNQAITKLLKDSLPDSFDLNVMDKYTNDELNFIIGEKFSTSANSKEYRLQYVDRLRGFFGIQSTYDYAPNSYVTNTLRKHHIAGTKDANPDASATLLGLFIRNQNNSFSSAPHVQSTKDINDGKIPYKYFTERLGLKGISKKSFSKFMEMMAADLAPPTSVSKFGIKELAAMTTLSKDLFDLNFFTKDSPDSDEERNEITKYRHAVRNISPYLARYAIEMEKMKDLAKRFPTTENKVKLKELGEKYKWLTRNGEYSDNLNRTNENLKSDTLSDMGSIISGYVEAVEFRIAKEIGEDNDTHVFTIDPDGGVNTVAIDTKSLKSALISKIETDDDIIENERSHLAQTYVQDLADDNNLKISVLLEGTSIRESCGYPDANNFNTEIIIENILKAIPSFNDETTVRDNLQDCNYADIDTSHMTGEIMEAQDVSTSGSSQILSSITNKSFDYKAMLETNERLHIEDSANQKEVGNFCTKNFEWTPLFEGEVKIDGYSISVIHDKSRLLDEGKTQDHCVYSYLSPASTGECIILSVQKNAERVATVELTHDYLEDFDVVQNYGPHNTEVPREVSYCVDKLIEMLNEGEIEIADEISPTIDLSLAEEDPNEYASILSRVDFDTDAAHFSYFIADDMIKSAGGEGIDQLLEDINIMAYFYDTDFYNDIQNIKRAELTINKLGHHITPLKIIKLKSENDLTTWNTDQLVDVAKGTFPTMLPEKINKETEINAAQINAPRRPQF